MATSSTNKNSNLFYQLYSTPNDLVQSGFVCNSAIDESDTSFDISKDQGEITDSNGNTLTSIDLSGIHSDEITEYYTETKILQPFSAYLLQGNVTGETYAAQYFPIIDIIQNQEEYDSYINVKFDIHYTDCGEMKAINIDTYKLRTEPGAVCDIIQAHLDELNIPVSVTIRNLSYCDCTHPGCSSDKGDFLVFQSTSEGYSFFVHSVIVTAINNDYENYNGDWVDYSETPFIGGDIDFDYLIDFIREMKPKKKGSSDIPDYSEIPCDLYKFLVNIAPLSINDKEAFAKNIKYLKEFESCFDALGEIIDDQIQNFSYLSSIHNDIYAYYWGNDNYSILNNYNIHDIISMLVDISNYILNSNVHGPYVLEEDYDRRLYNQKYQNGAFRGMLLVPDWNSATTDQSVLKLAHVSDYINIDEKIEVPEKYRVEGFWCNNCVNLYRKVKANVKIDTLLQSEYEIYKACDCDTPVRKITSNDSLATCIDNVWTYDKHSQLSTEDIWTNNPSYSDGDDIWSDTETEKTHDQHHRENHILNSDFIDEFNSEKYDFMKFVPCHDPHHNDIMNKENYIGLYRYMQYLNENDLWSRVGQFYAIIGAKDDYQSKVRNLQNSVLIYNPNNVPIRIRFMVFS